MCIPSPGQDSIRHRKTLAVTLGVFTTLVVGLAIVGWKTIDKAFGGMYDG